MSYRVITHRMVVDAIEEKGFPSGVRVAPQLMEGVRLPKDAIGAEPIFWVDFEAHPEDSAKRVIKLWADSLNDQLCLVEGVLDLFRTMPDNTVITPKAMLIQHVSDYQYQYRTWAATLLGLVLAPTVKISYNPRGAVNFEMNVGGLQSFSKEFPVAEVASLIELD